MVAAYRERHCWHDAGRGPKGSDREVCCDCGKYRRNRRQEHGRYRPAVPSETQIRWQEEASQGVLVRGVAVDG